MNHFSCCVTGHRDIPTHQIPFVEQALRKEIKAALTDGCRHFISGFAKGADMIFAHLVLETQEAYPDVILEAALPYRTWMNHRSAKDIGALQKCKTIGVHSETYTPFCFSVRNRYMVNACSRVIAVYDGREKGGTASTIRYAETLGREIRIVCLVPAVL